RTDSYLFLRGADGQLPDRPTQVLHCPGLPIPFQSTFSPCPFGDLNGDGVCELVLFDVKSTVTSVDSLLEIALSRGVDFAVTIRTWQRDGFSRPVAPLIVTTVASIEQARHWTFFIHGDFNGDGRPDLVVQRSMSQWNIFFSTNDGRWFAPQPAMTFETPLTGDIDCQDLNGDGRAD